jgi:hypothetical protein
MNGEVAAAVRVSQAESLLKSLKGVRDARINVDARGRFTRVDIVASDADERAVTRNVHSALMAALGVALEPGVLQFVASLSENGSSNVINMRPPVTSMPAFMPAPEPKSAQVLEIAGVARKADLNSAARTAFDTLRAAQSSFHGFVFDGAELVSISGAQYVVVAVKRATTEARYCGAAPIIDSVNTASARALMNAVGVAAMGAPALEFAAAEEIQLGMLKA